MDLESWFSLSDCNKSQPTHEKHARLSAGDVVLPRAAKVSLRSFLSMNPSLFWSMMVKAWSHCTGQNIEMTVRFKDIVLVQHYSESSIPLKHVFRLLNLAWTHKEQKVLQTECNRLLSANFWEKKKSNLHHTLLDPFSSLEYFVCPLYRGMPLNIYNSWAPPGFILAFRACPAA